MTDPHARLFLDVFLAGAMSFGGLAAVLSSLRASTITEDALLTDEEFTGAYGLAVGAPGPNAIFLALLGYQVAGLPGAGLALAAWALPTMTLLALIGRTASSSSHAGIRSFRKALVPVVAGLLVAGSLASASTYTEPVRQWILTAGGLAVLLLRPRMNPVWMVLGSALLGPLVLL